VSKILINGDSGSTGTVTVVAPAQTTATTITLPSVTSTLATVNSPVFTGNVTGLGIATGTSFNSITGLSSSVGSTPGTATVGTSTLAARADHVHPEQTSVSGNAGTATTATNLSGGSITTAINTGTVGTAGASNTQFMGNASNAAAVSFHRSGSYAVNMGLDTDNVFRLGGWSDGANTYRYSIDASGNLVARGDVTAFSDERLKTNWRALDSDFVARLADVKSGIYDRIDTNETQVGVSAQSLQTLLPEAVKTDSDNNLSVAYGNAALAACIELAKEVVRLRALVESQNK
jgi:hypothetical protein